MTLWLCTLAPILLYGIVALGYKQTSKETNEDAYELAHKMALKLKYTDEHGILHIDMSPSSSPRLGGPRPDTSSGDEPKTELTDPKFDTINHRFGRYDLFGGKYDADAPRSLFRSRYNSVEEELANTPYAFATERSARPSDAHTPLLDITIDSRAAPSDAPSPSRDLLDDRFFNRRVDAEYTGLFGPEVEYASRSSVKTSDEEGASFTLTQLAHAQDRYYDLSSRTAASSGSGGVKPSEGPGKVNSFRDSFEVRSAPKERTVEVNERFSCGTAAGRDEAFKVLSERTAVRAVEEEAATLPVTLPAKKKKESSFAILAERPTAATSRSNSPRPVDARTGRVSPFKGRGFREETSRHSTPKASATNSRSTSPARRRTCSLSKIDNMAETAVLPPSIHLISGPQSPRNFIKENIEDIREISEINREKNEAEAERLRREEEEALLIEMGLLEKTSKSDGVRSVGGSRTTSRSNSPGKIKLRSRSNSPAVALNKESTKARSKEFINKNDGFSKPTVHKSRVRSVSKSQPQSSTGSPTHSKIPKRQNSVSPPRTMTRRSVYHYRKPSESSLNNQKFISNSVSSIHEMIKVGSTAHDKRASRSTQNLTISPAHIRGKPPISPGRGGPPPVNRTLSTKRLSPIVGTPSKSPIEDQKSKTVRVPAKPLTNAKKPIKTAGNTPATSRINSRQPSKNASRDPSPEKRKPISKPTITTTTRTAKPDNKPVTRSQSTKTTQKPPIVSRTEPKKPISRANSVKSLARTPSSKSLIEKPPLLKKRDSKTNLKEKTNSSNKINEIGMDKGGEKNAQKPEEKTPVKKVQKKEQKAKAAEKAPEKVEVMTQDSETQYDKVSNDKGELVILTKKNIISMTTAAITAQPLEVVTKVTNQLPAAFEKARERGVFERLSSKDSLAPKEELDNSTNDKVTENDVKNKDEIKEKKVHDKPAKTENTNMILSKEVMQTTVKKEDTDHINVEDDKTSKHGKPLEHKTIFIEDNIKLRPLQPPYNNPQVERARQKIDDIMRSPEISPANILAAKKENKEAKNTFKNLADKTKNDVKKSKDDAASKLTQLKEQILKQSEKPAAEIHKEATKIVDSIITPVEEPKRVDEKVKEDSDNNKIADIKTIDPIVMVVNEKKTNGIDKKEVEKTTETLVKGEPEVEVQSSNVSTPALDKMAGEKKMAPSRKTDGSVSDNSVHSNGGFPSDSTLQRFPHSTSTTPKPPPRSHRGISPKSPDRSAHQATSGDPQTKPPNICQRIINKCRAKCCACCVKRDEEAANEEARKDDPVADIKAAEEGKGGTISKLNCCRKAKDVEEQAKDVESAAVKAATIEFESETKRPRRWRDALCPCGRGRRVSDVAGAGAGLGAARRAAAGPEAAPPGCCGRAKPRRDSIVSERTPRSWCGWLRRACRRRSEPPSSRQNSVFSKNKSLSPMLPPEDNRPKLDTSLVEHTSVIRGAVPILPAVLAYFCLVCNIVVPGLGTIFSGMFCLCFGIPRFGVHDGAKHRIGSFVINLLVGCGQLFTVLFCLVGWGWSIWWGVIMVKTSRKYRKLKAEAAAEEAEAAPPVTENNHAGN